MTISRIYRSRSGISSVIYQQIKKVIEAWNGTLTREECCAADRKWYAIEFELTDNITDLDDFWNYAKLVSGIDDLEKYFFS